MCLAALPLVSAKHGRRLNDPVRVRIPDFSITLSPANPDLTTIDAKEVRDVAETMFEEYLENFEWGASTLYEYAGISGIKDIFVDDTISPPASVIKIRGGLVVFGWQTTVVPSQNEVETMLKASLYSLTDLLKVTGDFNFVETSRYDLILYPSSSPSQSPTLTVVPTEPPSPVPSHAPSFDTDVSALAKENTASSGSTSSSSQAGPLIGGAIAGSVVIAGIAALLLLNRRGHRRQLWKASAPHDFPGDDIEEPGLHKRDSLQDQGVTDGKSEAGSSMLGRMLAAAGAPPPRSLLNESPATTPQSSAGSDEESLLDNFGIEAAAIEPRIVKLASLESFDGQLSTVNESLQTDMLEPIDQNVPTAWQKLSLIKPFMRALTPTDISSTLQFGRWSDCSTDKDNEKNADLSDVETNFAPDDTWDFQDNDEEASDVDPFYTPAYPSSADNKTLLDKFLERSSTKSPEIV